MTDIRELLAKAQEKGIDDKPPAPRKQRAEGEYFEPPNGEYLIEVVESRPGKVKSGKTKGADRIGLWLEALSGPYEGERWWTNIVFGGKANNLNFGKLLGLGVEESTLESLGTVDAIAEFLVERQAKARVDINGDYVNTYFSRDTSEINHPADEDEAQTTPEDSTASAGRDF